MRGAVCRGRRGSHTPVDSRFRRVSHDVVTTASPCFQKQQREEIWAAPRRTSALAQIKRREQKRLELSEKEARENCGRRAVPYTIDNFSEKDDFFMQSTIGCAECRTVDSRLRRVSHDTRHDFVTTAPPCFQKQQREEIWAAPRRTSALAQIRQREQKRQELAQKEARENYVRRATPRAVTGEVFMHAPSVAPTVRHAP